MSGLETEVVEIAPEPLKQPHDSHDEEYESADDAYDDDEVEEIEVEEGVEEEEEENEEERSPSQQEKDKELDDDEDVKNPQFIPKRGYFYEHDDRTKEEDKEGEEEEPKKEEKKPPAKEPSKWSHDLFNEEDQQPKSKEELSRSYGYDIFTEEQAPRARRRRRYGRGPNKYTRQWEDEEAYQKPRGTGFRGRGSRGRGNFRGTNRRTEDENVADEEFPALPGSNSTPKAVSQPQQQQQSSTKPSFNKEQEHAQRRGSGEQSSRPHQSQDSRRRNNDYDEERNYGRGGGDNERNFGPRGGSRGGSSVGRGRGRRNEFSNRNRYPNKRDGDEEVGNENQNQYGQGPSSERERPANRPRSSPHQTGNSSMESKDNSRPNRGPTHSHQQTNGHVRETRPKDGPLPSKPPFTNTEYTGSHSLSNRERGSNRHQNQGHHHHEDNGRKGQGHPSNALEKGFTDLREVITAKRQNQQQQSGGQPDRDRRSQIPPRMQQQPQHQQHPQDLGLQRQQPEHHRHQQQEHQPAVQISSKPKRFSQRQRQAEQSLVSVQGGIPITSAGVGTSGGVPMGHVPNMIPVVTGADQMVPSPVPAYPQAPAYYEGPQVYETSGSPITVATVTNGTPVSQWTPHAYAPNAPYPSPPTGPQVPPAAFADHAAYIAAQQAGPIYSAPPPFIQDPTLLNYTGAPPFAPAYHPQANYQGFPQTPAPPPELYHAGVTYYNPQPQIQRQPPMLVPKPRTKSVLQLVEPPEKAKGERSGGLSNPKDLPHDQQSEHSQSPPVSYIHDPNVHGHVESSDYVQQCEGISLSEPQQQLPIAEQIRKPSPLPEQESWSAQMEDTNDSPEASFQAAPSHEFAKPSALIATTEAASLSEQAKDKPNSPQPPSDEGKKGGE